MKKPIEVGAVPRHHRARTDAAKTALKERIQQEALALFAEDGYAGFSMRKLAARLHFTATTLYAYYENKDDLLGAVIAEGHELLGAYLVLAKGDGVERLARLGKACLDFAFKNPQLYMLMFIQRPAALRGSAAGPALLEEIAEAIAQTPRLKARDESAEDQAAALFWATTHGLASLALTAPGCDEKWARRNFEVLIAGLKPFLSAAS